MEGALPLPALLSQSLVAFIIEFDNEFEHRVPHRTSTHTASPGAPWLISMALWMKFLRHVPDDAIAARDLYRRMGLPRAEFQNMLTRMSKWWGYVTVRRAPPPDEWIVRPTEGGGKALVVLRPLSAEVEARWRVRYGAAEIDRLRAALALVVTQLQIELPDFLPILGYGLYSRVKAPPLREPVDAAGLPLPAMLSKVLLAFALEYEAEAAVSMAIGANVLRVVSDDGARVRDLPVLSGVSKEAIAMALAYLGKRAMALVSTVNRAKTVALTESGRAARSQYHELTRAIEARWRERFGTALYEALQSLAHAWPGIVPYEDNWRATLPPPETLPHFPMVLHRGGYPDGS